MTMGSTPFVPHRDRHALHGITVVVETAERLFVGRLDTADEREIVLKDAGYHDDAETRGDYLARTAKFGLKRLEAEIAVPAPSAISVRPLAEVLA